ncbi:WD40 repeat-like protein [Rhizopogon salebrosus TDB-379]|nr:WD40 repeat-like protein [Rhizopogon salebrosus TDB-379]
MQGHTESVNGVAFFNDGRRVVTGSWDKTLRIWDAQKGTLVGKPFKGHQDSICSVAISPDDRRIASGGEDTEVIIWDVESEQKAFDPLVKHKDNVWSLCFSPNGKKLASGSEDETVIIWDAETGAVFATLEGHCGRVLSVAFSPDGQKLASGSSDTTILIWRADSDNAIGERLLQINAHSYSVGSVLWSAGGQQLISSSGDKTIKFWDVSNGSQIKIGQPCTDGHTGWIDSLAISSDNTFVATASNDKTVRLWSTTTHQQIDQALEHTDEVYCVAISPNGTLLASGGRLGEVYMWSIGDTLKRYHVLEKRKEELETVQQLRLIDVSPQQDMLPTSSSEGRVHDVPDISSVHPLLDVSAMPQETMEGKSQAGDETLEDVQLLDQELPDIRVKVLPVWHLLLTRLIYGRTMAVPSMEIATNKDIP